MPLLEPRATVAHLAPLRYRLPFLHCRLEFDEFVRRSSPFVYLAWLAAASAMMAFVLSMMLVVETANSMRTRGEDVVFDVAAVLAAAVAVSAAGGACTTKYKRQHSGDDELYWSHRAPLRSRI